MSDLVQILKKLNSLIIKKSKEKDKVKSRVLMFNIRNTEKELERELRALFTAVSSDPERIYSILETWLSAMAESDEGLHPKTVLAVASIFRKVVTEYVQIYYKTKFRQLLDLAIRTYGD